MKTYTSAFCWAGAIIGVALAGMFDVIDEDSMTTLLIALPVAGWTAVSGRGSCLAARRA